MNTDPNWPRASELLTGNPNSEVTLIGIGAHQTSISPTRADTTPPAVREALLRFSTYCASHDQDLRELNIFDAGNVKSPDHAAGEQRVHEQLACAAPALSKSELLTFLTHPNTPSGQRNTGSPLSHAVSSEIAAQKA